MPPTSFASRLAQEWAPADWRDVTVVLAVSGGADSAAMLLAMRELKESGAGRLAAAHLNHRLRGEESDRDEQFVRRLCRDLGVLCVVGQAENLGNQDWGDGLEAAAREARYEFLRTAALEHGARFVATAHTADDQAETVLHRIVRGTGIAGLAGIPRARPLAPGVTLIRPLLAFRRAELREYLGRQDQGWREDATNQILHFTRNRIRHDLLPQLAEYNAEVESALVRLARLAAEAQAVIDDATAALLDTALISEDPHEVVLDTAPLASQRPYLVCEFFIALWRRRDWPRGRFTQDDWRRLAELAADPSPCASLTFPGDIQARRAKDRLFLTRRATI